MSLQNTQRIRTKISPVTSVGRGHPGLGRRTDIVQLPNVRVSVKQVGTTLGVVEFVKGIVISGHFAANSFTAGFIRSAPALLLLRTIFTTACDCCLKVSFVQPVKSFFHLLTKHGACVKHKLITISWTIGVIAAVGIKVAVSRKVSTVLFSAAKPILASVSLSTWPFPKGAG